jgi:hypothetical protein
MGNGINSNTVFMPIHVFPLELRESTKGWSFMAFWPTTQPEFIYLPIPAGLTFSDSMNYSSINLGLLGDIGAKALSAAASSPKGSGVARKTGNAIGAMTEDVIKKAGNMNAAAVASIAARKMKQDDVANVIDYATKQVVAPNTRTTFQNSNVRNFQFQFKMVGKRKEDTDAIKRICELFQNYMYPEGTDVILKYPPTWAISFYDGDGNDNQYIPGIYESYLKEFSTTFNSSTNIFRDDGSPLEVDITLGFEETKPLNRQEIMELRGSKYNDKTNLG